MSLAGMDLAIHRTLYFGGTGCGIPCPKSLRIFVCIADCAADSQSRVSSPNRVSGGESHNPIPFPQKII